MPVISIRVSDEWLARVDAEADRCRWKRNAAVVNLTWDGLQVRGALDKEKRDADKHEGLASRQGRESSPVHKFRDKQPIVEQVGEFEIETGAGSGIIARTNRDGKEGMRSQANCPSCGGLNGMHQRGCKG